MQYEFMLTEGNKFYPIGDVEMIEVEQTLGMELPSDLKDFYREIGYGFIKGSKYNANHIFAPYTLRDFRLRANDWEFQPDLEGYEDDETDKIYFFKANESAYISIGFEEMNKNAIFYYDLQIADSLKEFLEKIQEDDKFYSKLY